MDNPRVQALMQRCQLLNKDIISTRGQPYKVSTLAKKVCLKRLINGDLPILRRHIMENK